MHVLEITHTSANAGAHSVHDQYYDSAPYSMVTVMIRVMISITSVSLYTVMTIAIMP